MQKKAVNHSLVQFFACLWLIILCLPVLAADDALSSDADWHYTLRPSDNIQSIGQRMLAPGRQWTDIVRYNRIDNVAALQAGSIIKIPIAWLKFQPKPAKTLSVDGSVLVRSDRFGQFKLLKANSLIHVGYEIMSREGTALIKLADNSIIRIESNTQIGFNRLSHYGDTGMVDTRIRLKQGGVITEVAPLTRGSRFEIRTPSAVAAVRGTEFRLRTDGNETQIEVTEGAVEFSHAHGSQTIGAGQGARVSSQSAIMDTGKLYEAPKRNFKNNTVDELPVQLSWEPQPGAEGYKYELRVDDGSGSIVQQQKLLAPTVALNNVSNGNYQVAMRAVDQAGYEGLDDVSSISVNLSGDTPAPLAPSAGSVVNSADLAFSWQVNRDATRSKIQVASDPGFNRLVHDEPFGLTTKIELNNALAPGVYYWRVLGLGADQIESASEGRKLSVRGLMKEVKVLSVNYVDNQVGLFWNSVDEAEGYVLQISDNQNFDTILREENIQKPSAFLKLTPGKSYYARIKGVPSDLYQSEYGAVETLFIPE